MPSHRRPAVPRTRLLARTVHGLEHVAAQELRERGCTVLHISDRQLLLDAPADLLDRPPRTVDDLFLLVASAPDPGPTKADLARLTLPEPALDLTAAHVSVSASTAGRRTYNRYDVEDVVGGWLAARLGARYTSRRDGRRPPPGAVDWRVTVGPTGLHIGLRGARPPLHRRHWKRSSVPGTLHPPVAAAMARLAGIGPGQVVVDPCCGAGTLLIEAATRCPHATYAGSDLSPAAMAAAMANAEDHPSIAWSVGDAARLPCRGVDHVLTNPPWDRQVAVRGSLAGMFRAWRRALVPDGRLTCLLPPGWVVDRSWRVVSEHPISLSGQHPVIVVAEPVR